MDPRKHCMLNNEKLVTALKALIKELESDNKGSDLRTCSTCRFGTDNSLAVFDMHCQFGYAYEALSTVLEQMEELSKQGAAS